MREIKFRAWDNVHKCFNSTVAANILLQIHEESEDLTEEYGKRFFLSQFTGLHDKNGKDIYEGDILSYPSMHTKNLGKLFNNVVEFATGQSLCGWRMRNKSCVVKATPYKFLCSEIIGNIYENPELVTPKPERHCS